MATIDRVYKGLLNQILDQGYIYTDKSRDIDCKQIDSASLDIRMDAGFPAITTKKLHFKSVVTELIWFLRGGSNIKYLVDNGCNIWNKDAYNWYLKDAEVSQYLPMDFISFVKNIKEGNLTFNEDTRYRLGDVGKNYGVQWNNWFVNDGLIEGRINQISNMIRDIKKNPYNRRNIVLAWNPGELHKTALPPCHFAFQLIVAPSYDGQNSHTLSLKWHQRSVDTFLGLPFNIASYAILLEVFARVFGFSVGRLHADLTNVHLYANHITLAIEQTARCTYKHKAPKLIFSQRAEYLMEQCRKEELFFDELFHLLEPEDIKLEGYTSFPELKGEMLAPKN